MCILIYTKMSTNYCSIEIGMSHLMLKPTWNKLVKVWVFSLRNEYMHTGQNGYNFE